MYDTVSAEIDAIRNDELLNGMSLHGRHGWDLSVDPSPAIFARAQLLAPVDEAGALVLAGITPRFCAYTDQEALLVAPPDALLSFAWPAIPRQVPARVGVVGLDEVREAAAASGNPRVFR